MRSEFFPFFLFCLEYSLIYWDNICLYLFFYVFSFQVVFFLIEKRENRMIGFSSLLQKKQAFGSPGLKSVFIVFVRKKKQLEKCKRVWII